MKSEHLGLSKPMVAALAQHGITTPTPIQTQIIPAIMAGKDVLAQSETGSGKTISFAVPIIEKLERGGGIRALVLVPTRELCVQVAGEFTKFSRAKQLGIVPVYGGVGIGPQSTKVRTADVVVATPGRLLDLLERRALSLGAVHFLVADEADRMLDMGFIRDIDRIMAHVPKKRQTLFFSATVSKEIEDLSRKYLSHPELVKMTAGVKPAFLQQTYYRTTPEQKLDLLVHLLTQERDLTLVFCNRKHVSARIAKRLAAQGVHAKALHGDMSQPQRERVTAEFRDKKFGVLVATDVAARGLHIEDITHVYNYEIPKDVESYTHRVGRTARAGKTGEAISLVATEDERKFFQQILFTYQGRITLKEAGGFVAPASPPPGPRRAEQRQPQRPAQRPPQRQQQQQQQQRQGQRPQQQRSPQRQPQRPGQRPPQGKPADRRTPATRRSSRPQQPRDKRSPVVEESASKKSWRARWREFFGQ
jgi:ATP-dependent RNA helicase DeaD